MPHSAPAEPPHPPRNLSQNTFTPVYTAARAGSPAVYTCARRLRRRAHTRTWQICNVFAKHFSVARGDKPSNAEHICIKWKHAGILQKYALPLVLYTCMHIMWFGPGLSCLLASWRNGMPKEWCPHIEQPPNSQLNTRCFSPSVSLSLSSDRGDNGWHYVTRRCLSVWASQRAINHFGETVLWLLMNFSHATTDAGYSITARRSFLSPGWKHLSGIYLKLCSLAVGLGLFVGRGWDVKLSRSSRQPLFVSLSLCGAFRHCLTFCTWPSPPHFLPCVSYGACLVLVNEREELWLSCFVFLGLCACGLCGLSHSEEPWGDISGHGLTWVQAHTESLTDPGVEERGMFSYWEETRPDYEGEQETRRKGRWLWVSLCLCRAEMRRQIRIFLALPFCCPHIWKAFHFIFECDAENEVRRGISSFCRLIVANNHTSPRLQTTTN